VASYSGLGTANPGRREGIIADEAVPGPERRPLILHSSFGWSFNIRRRT
jgi:hypothetical protein